MHIIPFNQDGMRPDQLEEFILAHEWLHSIYSKDK